MNSATYFIACCHVAIFVALFSPFPSSAQDVVRAVVSQDTTRRAQLTKTEMHFFHRSNKVLTDEKRQENLELFVFGSVQEGSIEVRMKKLEIVLKAVSPTPAMSQSHGFWGKIGKAVKIVGSGILDDLVGSDQDLLYGYYPGASLNPYLLPGYGGNYASNMNPYIGSSGGSHWP